MYAKIPRIDGNYKTAWQVRHLRCGHRFTRMKRNLLKPHIKLSKRGFHNQPQRHAEWCKYEKGNIREANITSIYYTRYRGQNTDSMERTDVNVKFNLTV